MKMSELEKLVKKLEKRLDDAEEMGKDLQDGIDVLSDIINTQQATLQKHVVEVTDHFSDTLEPRVIEIVRKALNDARTKAKRKT